MKQVLNGLLITLLGTFVHAQSALDLLNMDVEVRVHLSIASPLLRLLAFIICHNMKLWP
jgi:hypothetical protein